MCVIEHIQIFLLFFEDRSTILIKCVICACSTKFVVSLWRPEIPKQHKITFRTVLWIYLRIKEHHSGMIVRVLLPDEGNSSKIRHLTLLSLAHIRMFYWANEVDISRHHERKKSKQVPCRSGWIKSHEYQRLFSVNSSIISSWNFEIIHLEWYVHSSANNF